MLLVTEDVMTAKALHEMAVDDVLHGLGTDGGQRNRTVVGGLALVSLLEQWGYKAPFQSVGTVT